MLTYTARRLVVLGLLLTQFHLVRAQPLQFTKFQQEDFVTTIFQDKLGFLWLGTPGGLQRYDGYHFKIFQYDETDSLSLGNNEVWNIVEDHTGHLWIGTNNGLNRLDPQRETFTRFKSDIDKSNSLTNDQIIDLLSDTAGTVWVATVNGLNRYLPEADGFKHYLFHPNAIRPSRTPIQTRDGTIWVGVRDTLYRYEEITDSFRGFQLPGNDETANFIRLIYEDATGHLWIGTQRNGAFRFDVQGSTFFEHYCNEPGNSNSLSHNKVSAFIQNGNELWIGTTGGGLNVLNLKTGDIIRYTGIPPDPFGVNSEVIRDAWKDRQGNIWLGSYYDGLYQFKNSQRLFRNFDQNTGLLARKVTDIDETTDGKIWIAMGAAGLAIFDPESDQFIDYYQSNSGNTNGLPSGTLVRIRKDQSGQLWVASATDGISRFDPESGVFSRQLPKQPKDLGYLDLLNDFLVEENGDIWIARQVGLVKYVAATQSFQTYLLPDKKNAAVDHSQNSFVTGIYRDRQQQIWFTTNGGINLYQPATDSFEFFPCPDKVLGMLEDSKGIFWVGSTGLRFDPKKKTFSEAANLTSSSSMLEDGKRRIWLYNTNYVICYDPAVGKMVNLLDKEDGLASGFYWTGHLSKNGKLFLGGIDGLSVFHPDSLEAVMQPPRTVLTDFRLFNRTVPLSGSRN